MTFVAEMISGLATSERPTHDIRTVITETGSGGMSRIIAQKGGAMQRGLLRADVIAREVIAAVGLLRRARGG